MDWFARLAVGFVFVVNVQCALGFIIDPGAYAGAYELSGGAGEAAIAGLGVAFLMWNATYPLVIWKPRSHMTLFGVILVQQAIGLVGESLLRIQVPAGHEVLLAGLDRFIAFDGLGLVLMVVAFILVVWSRQDAKRG